MMGSSEELLVELATEAILVDISDSNFISDTPNVPLNLTKGDSRGSSKQKKGRNSFYSLPRTLSEDDDPFGILDMPNKPPPIRQDEEPNTGMLIEIDDPEHNKYSTISTVNEPNWDQMMNEAQSVALKVETDEKVDRVSQLRVEEDFCNSPTASEGLLDSPLALIETSDNFLVVLTPEKSPTKDLRNRFGEVNLSIGEEDDWRCNGIQEIEAVSPGEIIKDRRLSSIKENLDPPKQTQSRFGSKSQVKRLPLDMVKPKLTGGGQESVKPKLVGGQSVNKKPSVRPPLTSQTPARKLISTPVIGGQKNNRSVTTPTNKKQITARISRMTTGTPISSSGTTRAATPVSRVRGITPINKQPQIRPSLSASRVPGNRPRASLTLPLRPTSNIRPRVGPLNASVGALPRPGTPIISRLGGPLQRPSYNRSGSSLSSSTPSGGKIRPSGRVLVPQSPANRLVAPKPSNNSMICSTPGQSRPRLTKPRLPSPIRKK